MTGMLCLVSLAAFAGAVARRWNTRWLAGSVVASAAAMFSKETAVVLPVLIASYDWLLCGGQPAPQGRRLRFYAALCATWGVLGLQMAVQSSRYQATGAFDVSATGYFLTQPRVILHYLRLAFWPTGLCFDFNFPLLDTWKQIAPSLLYMVGFGIVVLVGLVRRKAWAWPGVAFLLALAASSSFVPRSPKSIGYTWRSRPWPRRWSSEHTPASASGRRRDGPAPSLVPRPQAWPRSRSCPSS